MFSLIINIFMFICIYPTLLILYFSQKSAGEAKSGALLGIRYSSEWLSKEELTQIQQTYRRRMKRYTIALALSPLAFLPIPYFSISITLWMAWLLIAIVLMLLPYAQGFNQMKALKRLRAMPAEQSNNTLYELKDAGNIRTLYPADWFPLVAINLILPAFTLFHFRGERLWSYSIVILTFSLSTLLLVGCALWMDRMKTQVISRDSDINVNFARANKKLWKGFWLINCWVMTAYTALMLIYLLSPNPSDQVSFYLILGGSIGLCIFMIFLITRLAAKVTKLNRLYEEKADFVPEQDEKGWIGGIFYYNPQDHHTMVAKRAGIGTTCNMATPFGKGIAIFTALCLLVIPLSSIWLMLEEFTPPKLTLQDDALMASHINAEYTVPLEDIESLTLLTELPRGTRVMGTSMSTLAKGTFRNSADGRVQECLNPMLEYFLRVETADTIYYLSSYDDNATLEIYESLCR